MRSQKLTNQDSTNDRLDRPLWVVLGNIDLSAEAQSADAATSRPTPGATSGGESATARIASFDALPADWRAWQSVDLLILPTGKDPASETSLLSQITAERDAVLQLAEEMMHGM